MKPIHAALTAMAGLLALLNSPLLAQETTEAPQVPLQEEATPRRGSAPSSPRRQFPPESGRMRNPRQGEEAVAPYIGVLTTDVPRELRAHFGLPEGFGLLVQDVMPDTPAQEAGVKVDDVLVRFEDQRLVNTEQLQTLVRSKKKDDLVPMTVISNGLEKQVNVRIGERMMPAEPGGMRRGEMPFQQFFGGDPGSSEVIRQWRDTLEEYQRQMREWSRDRSRGPRPLPPVWNGPGRREDYPPRQDGRGSRGPAELMPWRTAVAGRAQEGA